jgi:hypothetical protein
MAPLDCLSLVILRRTFTYGPMPVSPPKVAMAMDRLKSMLLDPNLGYGKQLLRFLA